MIVGVIRVWAPNMPGRAGPLDAERCQDGGFMSFDRFTYGASRHVSHGRVRFERHCLGSSIPK